MKSHRHAFLIIAHHQWDHLKKLLTLLDHPRVDFYLHIDKKAKGFSYTDVSKSVTQGNLYQIPSLSVNWGGRSQIDCEFALIRAAHPRSYSYYHLISGVDLPLKKISEILDFFDANEGKEFVNFSSREAKKEELDRFRYYYPLQEWVARSPFLDWLQWKGIALQKRLGMNRLKKNHSSFAKGANWFSCTHAFLESLLADEKRIKKKFRWSRCCDELFLQSHLIATPFRHSLYDPDFSDSSRSFMRYIDWNRGAPYTFRNEDLEELLSSPYLFARKFDYQAYPFVVDGIVKALKE